MTSIPTDYGGAEAVNGPPVKFSQFNGIICYGEIVAQIDYDGEPAALVRYWYNPEGDPPRRPYVLVQVRRLRFLEQMPSNYVAARMEWP